MAILAIGGMMARAQEGPGAEAQGTNAVPPDKSGYTLFNPTPDHLMRDLSPDRPDVTESAYTVDAGHYQLEADFFNYTYDKANGTTTKAWEFGDFNLKAGLLNNVDAQLIYDNYLDVHTAGTGYAATQSGFGDLTARLKINLWGDDSGKTAFALLPYVTFPTGTDGLGNHGVEGGMIFPFTASLPYDFDLSMETSASIIRNVGGSGYHEESIASASLDHPIAGNLSGFLEFAGTFSTEPHTGWVGTVDTGLEYMVTKNVQLDCDCYFGVTRAAPQYNPFAGITIRY